jgi:hypothetical protein
MRRFVIAIACLAALGWGGIANAAPLNLTLNDHPDVTVNFIDVSYVANNSPNNFSISGYNVAMDDDGVGPLLDPDSFIPGSFAILASVTTAGVATGGTLTITGDYTSTLGISGTLVTGSLYDFGYDSPGSGLDYFEFRFHVTGGLMATSQYFGVPGTSLGVIYDAYEDLFASNAVAFQSSFANVPFGDGWLSSTADIAPLPEPGTVCLMFLAAMPLVRRRWVR